MRLHLSLYLGLSLAVASCVDREADVADNATDEANLTVSSTAVSAATAVRMHLWRPAVDITPASFWPAGARRVQVLITAGDAGDRTTNGNPTTYVWIVKNGSTVYKIWRVVSSQMNGTNGFVPRLNHAIAVAESGPDNGASHVILGSGFTKGPKGPPIGPGGDGEFPANAVAEMTLRAASL